MMIRRRANPRLRRLVLIAGMLAAIATAESAKADDWPKPAQWANRYAFEGPDHADFYKLASIRAALQKLIGDQFYREVILAWRTSFPILVDGDSMVVEACMSHYCDSHQVTTIIQGRRVDVCTYRTYWQETDATNTTTGERVWFLEGAGVPVVERLDPGDATGCLFDDMADAMRKVKHARELSVNP